MQKKIVVPYRPNAPMRGQPGYRPRQAFVDNRRMPSGFRGFGASATMSEGATVGGVVGGASAVAVGATIGSVVPGLGTAIGAAVGLIIGSLIHTGQGPEREAVAVQLDNAIQQIPTGAGIGRQIPWNENNHGLQQMIQGLMTSQVYMSWDSGLQSPSINAAWALYFISGVKAVTAAIMQNPVGKTVSVAIPVLQGGYGRPGNFTFVNPGISVGPDVISAKIIMGNGGLMYWMMINQGTVPVSQAQENGSNASAQKVFSLMIDHAANDLAPASPVPVAAVTNVAPKPVDTVQPVAAKVVTKAPVVVKAPVKVTTVAAKPATAASVAKSTVQPVTVATSTTTSMGTPVVPVDDTAALIAALLQQGATASQAQQAALESLAANGVQATPAVQAQVASTVAAASPGLSMTDYLMLAAVAVGGFLLLKSPHKKS